MDQAVDTVGEGGDDDEEDDDDHGDGDVLLHGCGWGVCVDEGEMWLRVWIDSWRKVC